MHKFIKDCLTGPDGITYDPSRFLWILGTLSFMFFTGYDIYKTNIFNMQAFSFAFSALLVAGAAGVKVKESTEPQPAPPVIIKNTRD